MDLRRILFGFLIFLLLSSFASARQIIILNESDEDLYSLGNVVISGDLKTNDLDIKGAGEILSGENVKVYLFGPATDVLVKDVYVDGGKAPVSFDEKGYYFIVAEGKFGFNGKLLIRKPGQIQISVAGPMNDLSFKLENGYAVDGDRFGLLNERILIQRAAKTAMIVDGAFRFTYAERDQFLYQVNFKSFGKGLGGYALDLLNGEKVSSVTGVEKWEQKDNKLVLELSGNTASVTVRGFFTSTRLQAPLREDRHHVIVESDPEKKISVSTTATEIDLSESKIAPQYPNARVFLASRQDVITVQVKRLDLLPSLAAAVKYASNTIAVTQKGQILGELNYNYANTGVDYIEVDTPGNPLYAATQKGPVKLTSEGKLLLALPKTTYGTLDVVYFATRSKIKPVDIISIPLAKTDLPISRASTNIYLPSELYVLETFGARGGSELPSLDTIILYCILMLALGWFLVKEKKFTVYYLVASIGVLVFSGKLFLAFVAISLGIISKRVLSERQVGKFLGGAVAIIAVVVLIVVSLVVTWQLGVFNMGGTMTGSQVREYGADYAVLEEAEAPSFKSVQKIGGDDAAAITVPVKKGVYPVKLEIPSLGKTISVTNHLVTKENQVELKVLVIASYFKYLIYAVSVWAASMGYMISKKQKIKA